MKLALLIRVFSAVCFAVTSTLAVSMSRTNCQEKCGDVTIPYPFGIGAKCSANPSFAVICQNSTIPPRPFLSSINLEILRISLYGAVIVNVPVSPMNCSDALRAESVPISLKGGPFFVSAHYNSLVVMGCKNSVLTSVGGCTATCDANSTDKSCNGVNCCQMTIPRRVQELRYYYQSTQETSNSSFCGYVFPVDKKWLQNGDHRRYQGLWSDAVDPFDPEFGFAPLVLEWELETTNFDVSCISRDDLKELRPQEYAILYIVDRTGYCSRLPDNYQCRLLDNYKHELRYYVYYDRIKDYVSSSKYCSCTDGYEGNPYIECSDIDECAEGYGYGCSNDETCVNIAGSYSCRSASGNYEDENDGFRAIVKKTSVVLGALLGLLILLASVWKIGKAFAEASKAIEANRKFMFFKRNGGLLLEQQLAEVENGLAKTRLFSSVELAKATDDYNENRVLGRGGEGVVYKGMLEDGWIVAIKKSERVNLGNVEAFINEVVIVSQINHRNVVKLLGCCLESEVPRLVYEFIPNGTLFSHIHHPHEDFPLFWELRVRIAKQVAGALAYLHSAASVPIYHRDIKSTNILLDNKYHAKISDFGTSRSISIDQTHVTTRVVGTFGYLDPEYFQSNQFTEKSDVYSFGVVLVELLTGEKAISAARVEEGRGLAMHFLYSMEENQLFDIVDARVLREGGREEIEAMAEIARRCLHLNGKSRPTMMEVARRLEEVSVKKEESELAQNRIESSGCNSVEDSESDSFSSISEIIELP